MSDATCFLRMRQRLQRCALVGLLFSLSCAEPVALPAQATEPASSSQPESASLPASLAQSLPASRPIGEASLQKEYILADIQTLSQPSWEGRGAGTSGLTRASTFLAKQLQEMGFSPGGKDGSYFQPFEVIVGATLGPNNALSDETGAHSLQEFTPLPMSSNGEVEAELVYVGYGRQGKAFSVDDYQGLSVKEKIVIIVRGLPPDDKAFGKRLGSGFLPWIKAYTARKLGAKGVIFLSGPLGQNSEDQLPPLFAEDTVGEMKLPVVQVKKKVVEAWLTRLAIPMDTLRPQALPMKVKLSVELSPKKVFLQNVIGVLEGEDNDAPAILLSAHYDHVGMGGSSSLDVDGTFAPHQGADDNASGTAALLSLAYALSSEGQTPKRRLLVCFFSGEELGLLGSKAYLSGITAPKKALGAVLNLDMVGRLGEKLEVLGVDSAKRWPKLLKEANKEIELRLDPKKDTEGRSDHATFLKKGVPALLFFTGFHKDYHKPSDSWEKINIDGIVQITRLVFRLTRLLLEKGP